MIRARVSSAALMRWAGWPPVLIDWPAAVGGPTVQASLRRTGRRLSPGAESADDWDADLR
jgi:hypothetical protein